MTFSELQTKIERASGTSISNLIYDYLSNLIFTLEIKPRETINETRLSSELNISRSPIRNAIDRLEHDGLIIRDKGKTAIVSDLSSDEYYCISELRMSIEGQAAYSAAKVMPDAKVNALEKLLNEVRLGDNASRSYPENDTRFHEYIIRSTLNPFIISAYGIYKPKIIRYRYFINDHIKMTNYSKEMRNNIHTAIFNGIKYRNPEAARLAAIEDATLMKDSTRQF